VRGLVALMFLMWFSPSVTIMLLGGFAIAPAISFPVRAHSRFMPRGWVILASFLALVGVATLALVGLVPILITQLVSLTSYVPEYATGTEQLLRRSLLEPLPKRGLLPGTAEEYITNLGQDLLNLAQSIAQQILGELLSFISGTFSLVLTLLGVLFVAVYFLTNVRNIKVTYLRVMPRHYRTDVRDLWDAFAFSLSRYLLGFGLRTTHHSAAKGPRVPPGPAARGQRLPPRIQGQTLRIPSILIFLAIIAGGRSWVSSALSSPSQLWPCSGHSSIFFRKPSAFAPS
jgi:predicted PurR-regulated permease PerM